MAVHEPHARLWPRVHALVDAASTAGLEIHRLQLIAADRYRSTGRDVPARFAAEERLAAARSLAVRPLLERIVRAYGEPVILLKGPEVAALYPRPELRSFGDLDLLVRDAHAAQDALRAAGFEEMETPAGLVVGKHHLHPLELPGLPLGIEVHSTVNWLEHLRPPGVEELFAAARPSAVAIDGVAALPPEHHVLILAAHSWSHEPLRRLRDVLDIGLALSRADMSDVERLARQWEIERLWSTMRRAVATIGEGARPSLALRTWGHNLLTARDRTVFEGHLERWFSDLSVMPLGRALLRAPSKIAHDLFPESGEPWTTKGRRSVHALRNAHRSRSLHDEELDARGVAGPNRRGR